MSTCIRSDRRPASEAGKALFVLLGLIALVLAVAAGAFSLAVFMMKQSPAYQASERFVRSRPEIRQVVGDDMKFGLVARGTVVADPNQGSASMKLRVRGRQGTTLVEVLSQQRGAAWKVVSARYIDRDGAERTIVPEPSGAEAGAEATSARLSRERAAAAFALLRANRTEAAIAEYNRALATNPRNAEAYYWRGIAWSRAANLTAAIADLERAIELEPDQMSAYESLDLIFNRQRNWNAVVRLWSGLIEKSPSNRRAYYYRAGGYLNQGDRAAAVRDAEKACELGDQNGCTIVKRLR